MGELADGRDGSGPGAVHVPVAGVFDPEVKAALVVEVGQRAQRRAADLVVLAGVVDEIGDEVGVLGDLVVGQHLDGGRLGRVARVMAGDVGQQGGDLLRLELVK